MRGFARIVCLSALLLSPALRADTDGWVKLFDDKTLKGWEQRNGTATYRVEDGSIVGKTSEGSPNSFLCTVKEYGDFEMTFEVKVDDALNSGVQIRSKTKDNKKENAVHGPQVEIATDGNAGRIWGEALPTGWIDGNTDLAKTKKAFKNGEWNKYRVLAKGKSIKTWINDVPVADCIDDKTNMFSGFIGLQVHGIPRGKGPYEVRFRNLIIQDLDKPVGDPGDPPVRVDPKAFKRLIDLEKGVRGKTEPSIQDKRTLRWALTFNTKDGKDYLNQLAGLGAMVALPVQGEKEEFLLIRDLKQPHKAAVEDISKVDRIYWIDDRAASVAPLLSALPKYPNAQKPEYIVAFFPKELEKRLSELELQLAKKDKNFRTEDQIHETKFRVVTSKEKGVEVQIVKVQLIEK
jgi:hypothetical protein